MGDTVPKLVVSHYPRKWTFFGWAPLTAHQPLYSHASIPPQTLSADLAPGGAVKGAVAGGFGDVCGLDIGAAGEVGDSTRNLYDAVVGAGRHVVARHSRFE